MPHWSKWFYSPIDPLDIANEDIDDDDYPEDEFTHRDIPRERDPLMRPLMWAEPRKVRRGDVLSLEDARWTPGAPLPTRGRVYENRPAGKETFLPHVYEVEFYSSRLDGGGERWRGARRWRLPGDL